jgi:hypothetical protein
MEWYPSWLETQIKAVPPWISECIHSLPEAFKGVALITGPGTSIDDMASHLLRHELIRPRKDQDDRLVA